MKKIVFTKGRLLATAAVIVYAPLTGTAQVLSAWLIRKNTSVRKDVISGNVNLFVTILLMSWAFGFISSAWNSGWLNQAIAATLTWCFGRTRVIPRPEANRRQKPVSAEILDIEAEVSDVEYPKRPPEKLAWKCRMLPYPRRR